MLRTAVSQIRQNFHEDSERAINEKINVLLRASYAYLSMAFHFDRDDVALQNVHKHFLSLSDKKRHQADKLMKYQNQRGGRVILATIQKPARDTWGSTADALKAALELERGINSEFVTLHNVASSFNDAHLTDFVEEEFLDAQVESIKATSDLLTSANRAGSGLGEYMFDKESFED